jgi:hypothetical protein
VGDRRRSYGEREMVSCRISKKRGRAEIVRKRYRGRKREKEKQLEREMKFIGFI